MVHIGYFIDDICLPPADLTGTCHGISFYGFSVIILHLLYHPLPLQGGGGGFKKDSISGFLSVYWDTKYKFQIF